MTFEQAHEEARDAEARFTEDLERQGEEIAEELTEALPDGLTVRFETAPLLKPE